jgi:immune inhibitor A
MLRRGEVLTKMAKILSIAIALTMVLGVFAVLLPGMTAGTPDAPNYVEPERYDVGPKLRSQVPSLSMIKSDGLVPQVALSAGGLDDYYEVGDIAPFLVLDDYDGYYFFDWFEMRENGTHCEVWVQLDRYFPDGDARNDRVTINDTNVEYIANEFDNVIYPTEKDYFAEPAALDGSNSVLEEWGYPESYLFRTTTPGKVMIMISNIRDANYYTPYPYYIAGYFDPSIKAYYDRNIINIDCYDWKNRTTGSAPRPYVYESTVAHEYQHLLHDATDPDEELWINEGCSMYAEYLCGYGIDPSYINSYLYTPDNSLTVWGDQANNDLADYGAALLFMMYLNDHFGGSDTITALFHNQDNGALSVTETLNAQGYKDWNFDKVFHAWILANMIRSDNPGGGLYNYKSIDLNAPTIIPLSSTTWYYYPNWGYISHSNWYGDTYTILGYDTGVSTLGSYGVRYYEIAPWTNWSNTDPLLLKFAFDGQDYVDIGWMNTNGYWWSGADNNLDVSLVGNADLTGMKEASLTFDTYYYTEESWDFGFVQVSNDSGATWVSLANEYTTNQSADGAIAEVVNNLPGLTGYSGGWVTMSFNLTAYAGQDIMFRFRYVTDPAVVYPGWWVDNVYVNDKLIDEGSDVIGLTPVYPDADYTITVYAPGQYEYDGQYLLPLLFEVNVHHGIEQALRSFSSLTQYDIVYVAISTNQGPVDYNFGTVHWTP